eukprot:6950411-Prymnesium_polylepis.1
MAPLHRIGQGLRPRPLHHARAMFSRMQPHTQTQHPAAPAGDAAAAQPAGAADDASAASPVAPQRARRRSARH